MVSYETAENIMNELFPQDVVLGDVNPDWTQGEVVATRSIRLTSGFHASADDNFHAHIVEPIIDDILEEEFWVPKEKNFKLPPKNITNNIDFLENEDITIFPNPTTGIFTIKNNSHIQNFANSKIVITNITGQTIQNFITSKSQNFITIDISNTKQGIYLLKIQTEEKILTHKIIKQ